VIGLGFVYVVAGLAFVAFAAVGIAGRRFANAGFYALIAASFLAGDRLGDLGNGVLVLAIAALGGTRLFRSARASAPAAERERQAALHGDWLFVPALIVPAVAVAGTILFKHAPALVEPKQATLVALAVGALLALAAACAWLRPRARVPFLEGARLMDGIGWAAALPQMLAALGALFALAGVGDVVGGLVGRAIPAGSLGGAVAVYVAGMAGFTIMVGNAFAAFPVMIAAVGVPLLVRQHHGDPAAVAAVGMLAGFCGTLLTPMAANFNLVPVGLLGLRDRYAVIRAQAPTACALLLANGVLLYGWGFPQ
jgi:uncharacterized membrane protein